MHYVTWKTNLPRRSPLSQYTISPYKRAVISTAFLVPILTTHKFSTAVRANSLYQISPKSEINVGRTKRKWFTPIQPSPLRFSRKSRLLNKTGHVRIMYKKARSCNHCCCEKAISITYSQWVLGALGIQHAMSRRYIVIRCLLGSTVFFQIISKTARFSEKD